MSDDKILAQDQRAIAQSVQVDGGVQVSEVQKDEGEEIEPAPSPRLIDLVNPHRLEVGHVKERDPHFAGGKFYLPKLRFGPTLLIGRQQCKRASEADAAAQAWKDELVVEYDKKIASMMATGVQANDFEELIRQADDR